MADCQSLETPLSCNGVYPYQVTGTSHCGYSKVAILTAACRHSSSSPRLLEKVALDRPGNGPHNLSHASVYEGIAPACSGRNFTDQAFVQQFDARGQAGFCVYV